MPRRKRSLSPCVLFDDDFDEDSNSQSSRNGHPPIQRNAANARERARMRVLSSAFGRLKTKLPNIPPDTKLSKLDTLRLATIYIKQLRALAEGAGAQNDNDSFNQIPLTDHASVFNTQNGAPNNMTWPFGLHHIQHSMNRQLPLQCSTTNWNATNEMVNPMKSSRMDNETFYQTHNDSQQLHAWYSAQDINCNTQRNGQNNFEFFNGFNQMQHNPVQHFTGSLSSTAAATTHHQSTMPPIR